MFSFFALRMELSNFSRKNMQFSPFFLLMSAYAWFALSVSKSRIAVSYAKDEDGEIIKSTIRVSIAVDKKVANSEQFAKELAERVREELPPFIVEKVDYATAYCEHTNVLDEVEQINKKDLIMNPVKAGLIGGLVVLFVVCSIYLVKEKDAYVVTVTRDDED